ncbi:hypothetical protein A5844_002714, partial [Enterococcus sp. 10A9_DIV0425]
KKREMKFTIFTPPFLFSTNFKKRYIVAVSYTHLDVYKRQCNRTQSYNQMKKTAQENLK